MRINTTIAHILRPCLLSILGGSLGWAVAAVTLPACSSSSNSATPDGGAPGTPIPGTDAAVDDAATCAKDPPTGFTAAVAPSTDGTLGIDTAMVADENDDPMIAYQWFGPGGSDDATAVYFTRWDRCVGAFTAPVKVDTVGGVSTSQPLRHLALAYDATAKKIAIVYELVAVIDPGSNPSNQVYLQTSADKGLTWKGKLHVSDQKSGDGEQARGPVVAMAGGKIQIAYAQDNRACCRTDDPNCGSCASVWYLEGDGTTFTRSQVSDSGGPVQPGVSLLSLAVDSAGKPGLAFIGAPPTGYNTTIVFWRPGTTTPSIIMDSKNIQNDDPSVSLAFDGTKARVVAHLGSVAAAPYDMQFSASNDGVTWDAPTPLPRDATQATAWYQSLALDSKGGGAVSAYVSSGSGDNTCGAPRLVRSTDLKMWTACGDDATKQYQNVNGKYVQSYFTKGDKLTTVSTGSLGGADTGTGVVFWREP